MKRENNRGHSELRSIKIEKNYLTHPEGSVLICAGDTRVICTATVEERVPPHKKGSGEGWVTAEYSMLPRATAQRNNRDIKSLKLSGRSAEIQRLIGRSLRSAVDLSVLGERSIIIDCDVINADGGTRTASITGGFVALALALKKLCEDGVLEQNPIIANVAAVSAGIVCGEAMVDLCYTEDSNADVDLNVVMNDKGEFVEIQGTGEKCTFNENEFGKLLALCKESIKELINIQNQIINE